MCTYMKEILPPEFVSPALGFHDLGMSEEEVKGSVGSCVEIKNQALRTEYLTFLVFA